MGCLKDWAGKEWTLVSRVSIPQRPYISRFLAHHLETFPAKKKHIKHWLDFIRRYDILKCYAKILGKYAQEDQAVRQPNSDLDLLRSFIDLIEAERSRNSFQDKRIKEIEQQQDQLEDRVLSIEAIVSALGYGLDRNVELEYMENPYSLDGNPRCNY
jgi:hypothetical protein